jgi:serine protease Do
VAMGTIVQADGYIISKASELKTESLSCELADGRNLEAKIVARHEPFDLVLLKVNAEDLQPVEWTLSQSAGVGAWVAAVGPEKKPAAIGVISVAARNMPPITRDDLVRTPPANSGVMGVYLEDDDKGVFLTGFSSDTSPAKKAGLELNDYFIGINGKPIRGRVELMSTVQKFKAGDTLTVNVRRKVEGKEVEREVKITLMKRDAKLDRSDFQNRMGSELSDRRSGFPTILQHDSVIKPSDCGGPLVDLDGRVLGVNIARAGRTESYAIPSEALLPVLATLLSGKSTELKSSTMTVSTTVTPEEAVRVARESLQKAEAELKQIQDRVNLSRRELTSAETKLKDQKLNKLEQLPAPREIK